MILTLFCIIISIGSKFVAEVKSIYKQIISAKILKEVKKMEGNNLVTIKTFFDKKTPMFFKFENEKYFEYPFYEIKYYGNNSWGSNNLSDYKNRILYNTYAVATERSNSILDEFAKVSTRNRENLTFSLDKEYIYMQTAIYSLLCPECGNLFLFGDALIEQDEEIPAVKEFKEAFGEKYWKTVVGDLLRVFPITHQPNCLLGMDKDLIFKDKAVCPHCGKDLTEIVLSKKENSHLYLINHNPGDNIFCKNVSVIDDRENKKVVISERLVTYAINKHNNKMYKKPFRMRVTFMTETGQTYLMPVKRSDCDRHCPSHMYNMTYGSPFVTAYDFAKDPDAIMEVFDALAKAHNASPEMIANWKKGIEAKFNPVRGNMALLNCFAVFNRIPFLKFEEAYEISIIHAGFVSKGKIFNPQHSTNISEFINVCFKNLRIKPTKHLKKQVIEDFKNFFFLYLFKQSGFKDPNLFMKFRLLYDKTGSDEEGALEGRGGNQDIKSFINELIKIKGEPTALKQMGEAQEFYFRDAANSYNIIKAANGIVDQKLLKGNIGEIHDRLFAMAAKIKNENVPLQYEEWEEIFDRKCKYISFRKAVDTHELIFVGQDMHICVGGYGTSALKRDCIIIVGYNEKNKPAICIELIPNGKKKYVLNQAKAMCNASVQAYDAEALRQWVDEVNQVVNLKVENCFDYQHIQNNNISYEKREIVPPYYNYQPIVHNEYEAVEEEVIPF